MKRKFSERGKTLYQKPKPGRPQGVTHPAFWLAMDPLHMLKRVHGSKTSGNVGRKRGHLFGYRAKELKRLRTIAKGEARKILKYMTDKKIFEADNNVSEEAMESVLAVLREPGHPKDKLAASKVLLEYTQRKPATSSDVTLNKAETFLEAVLEDIGEEDNDGPEASESSKEA